MSALLNAAMSALLWVVMAVVLVEFALVDELPAARVRRMVVGVGAFLLLLLLHMVLRRLVLRLKGEEPVLLFTPQAHQNRTRTFFELDASRRVSGWDYAYSLLVGLGMLLAMAPALGKVVARSSV